MFSTPVLDEPLEVTGRVRAVLWVSTTAADSDVAVRLTDVYPDGRSMLVLDGIQRLRYRDSLASTTPVVPAPEPQYRTSSLFTSTSHRPPEGTPTA